jgi:hypothetical protein
MSFGSKLLLGGIALLSVLTARAQWAEQLNAGPLFHHFPLTLAPGHRTEALGPLFYSQQSESQRIWAVPPALSYTRDPELDYAEFDFAYPVLTYDRFGREYRWQFFQLLSFAGGQDHDESIRRRFTIFPLYFQQRSDDPELNYTAFFPFYGRLKNRLLRDEIHFVMFPIYSQSRRRDVVTDNYMYPLFYQRSGHGLHGWGLWPLYERERKEVTTRTDHWGDTQLVGGHDRQVVMWPFFFNVQSGIGTENPQKQQALLPFYSYLRSPQRDSTSYLWPLGVTITDDRERKYREVGAPWPLIVFASGEGKTTRRVWPFFSRARTDVLEVNWYLWPVYRFNGAYAEPLDRRRTRILFFLYSDLVERHTETGEARERRDLWPLFTQRRELNGNTRLQVLAPLEPLLPNNKSIERNYSPVWSLWRSENNPASGASSQSLLWNLYRRDVATESKKCSLLFGLFQYQSGTAGARARVFYIPVMNRTGAVPGETK